MTDGGGGWARAVARDWPALEVAERSGWRLGYSHGVTKRANSAVALAPDADPDEPGRFYRERGLSAVVQVWPGDEGLDGRLAERGYRVVEPSLVLARDLPGRPGSGTGAVVVGKGPEYGPGGDGTRETDVTARIMARAGMAHAVREDGSARGCAALTGDLMGVYGMATRPDARRRGYASQILAALLGWGHANGARRAYLLVVAANAGARALYEGAGFAEAGRYHYRVLDTAGPR
ncbi:GNAT family N-acetyltransferase [Actinorugispora endophytica]|uniref:Acetyltransferase (GNAT) family protein n=1 Tax=Actinorugispora endophytica TaxID=1605990 RepID=A0A4R6UPW0_9ACTN|nr:GNAT family N-acetyltransferase [Actinorugispora endophytica]TDQ48226.1 acetyltransferase (GNAT) family protein [Actinorugispora endophytica]